MILQEKEHKSAHEEIETALNSGQNTLYKYKRKVCFNIMTTIKITITVFTFMIFMI